MPAKSSLIIALSAIVIMIIYFTTHPSYQISLEAKYYYEIGDYEEANRLAKKAFEIDRYNKMAATIMTQSQYALGYVHYIDDAKNYIKQLQSMLQDGNIDQAERAKIRTIAEIMVASYKKLTPSVVIDKELIKQAKAYHDKFESLYEKAARK